MSPKAYIVGICCVAIFGCTQNIPQTLQQSEVEVSTQKLEKERASLEEQRTKLAADQERENKKQLILSSIKQLEQQRDFLAQGMLGRQQKISNLELQQNQLETDIRTYDGKVQSFMMAHKTAIACMGAVGVSLDDKNQYSQDAKNIAGAVTLVCGLVIASNSDFRQEVFFVVDQLTQADSYAKNLRGQFQSVQSQINTENDLLQKERDEASRLASDIQNYQSQLESI